MGCFDTISFPCACGRRVNLQSKTGDCVLDDIQVHRGHHNRIGSGAGLDLSRERVSCDHCGRVYEINSYASLFIIDVIPDQGQRSTNEPSR